ncbi:MAG TPA: hypothetical protein VMM13_09970 [Euzebya sp.]|nr:hypothetical protein [Euzebya sp.]
MTFKPVDAGHTEVAVNMAWEPESFAERLADWSGATERRVKGDLKRFKEFIESRPVETGAHRQTH